MAITMLVSAGTPVPTTGNDDWQKAMAQLTALKTAMAGKQMHLTEWTNTTTLPALAMGSYIQHAGAIYVVDAEDYVITVPAADGTYYVQLVTDGVTLAVSFVSDISGFSYNANHNGLYSGADTQVLPYQIIKAGSAYTKRKIINPFANNNFSLVDYLGHLSVAGGFSVNGTLGVVGNATVGGTLGVTGAISGATVNTGQGANEVYKVSNEPPMLNITSDTNISAMDIGETRFFVGGFDDFNVKYLKTPLVGKFIVVINVESLFGLRVMTNGGGYTNANTGIIRAEVNQYGNFLGVIRRVS